MPVTASAYNTYVGLKIESVNNPSAPIPTEWCLPGNYTTMTINDGAEDIDTVTTSTETCPGGTIWSSLVTLTLNHNYNVTLVYDDPGYADSDYNWYVTGTWGESCDTVCGRYAKTCVDPGVKDIGLSQTDMQVINGNECRGGASYAWPQAPCGQSDSCSYYVWQLTSGTYTCSAKSGSSYRFCTCTGLASWSFTFTAPAA